MKLRDYQAECVDAIHEKLCDHPGENVLAVLPTGAGKSLILSQFLRDCFETIDRPKVLCVTHVRELVEQNAKAISRLWKSAPIGIYSAGLGLRQHRTPIVFCSIQSVYKKAAIFGHVHAVVIDEAHLTPRRDTTMYRRFLAELKEINPKIRVIGLTATPYRLEGGKNNNLIGGETALFHQLAYEVKVDFLVGQAWLSKLVSRPVNTILDVTGVEKRNGDFVQGQLERAVNVDPITQAAVSEIVRHGHDRKGWLIFATGVDHAQKVHEAFQSQGITVATITGTMKKDERRRILEAYKAQQIRALVNVNVLTTGFDAPHVDLLAFLRPTQSLGLFVQMCGRGMRISEDKTNCLILDFAGNIDRLGQIDDIGFVIGEDPNDTSEWDCEACGHKNAPHKITCGACHAPRPKGEAPTKECDNCGAHCAIAARKCPVCGELFLKIEGQASNSPIMRMTADDPFLPVVDIAYSTQLSQNTGQNMLRVDYLVGHGKQRKRVAEFVLFEHGGYPRKLAEDWHKSRVHIQSSIPSSALAASEIARAGGYREPTGISIRKDGKYWKIVDVRFEEPAGDLLLEIDAA
mgnify:CR=1 FL=1